MEGRLGVVVSERRPDARRQGAAARRPGLAGGRCQRRPRQVAGADRAPARQGRPRPGWKGLRVAGLGDVQQARQVAFPTVSHGYVPAYETLVLDTQAADPTAYRVFVDARSGTVLARESPSTARATRPPRRRRPRRSTAAPAARTAAATREGPVHGGRRRRRPRDRRVGQRRQRLQRHRPQALQRHAEVAEADTVRTPERIRYAPDGGVPAGDYFVELCEFKDGQPPVEPRTYTGTISFDTSAPPRPTPRAGARTRPTRRSTRCPPIRGTTRARTPARTCAGSRARPRRTATWSSATSRRARRGTSARTPTPHLHDRGQQRALGGVVAGRRPARAQPVPPGQHDPRLHLPVDQRVVHQGVRPRHALRRELPGRQELRRRRGGGEPLHGPQPHARLRLPARLHRGQLQLPGVELRPHRVVPRERPGDRQRPGRRGRPPRRTSTPARATTRTCRRCPTGRRRSPTCTCGSRSRAPSTRPASTATSTPASSATSTPT